MKGNTKMRNIHINFLDELPLAQQDIELVERKGVGHPDSICDGLAEAVSRSLSKEYLKRFDRIMHHNTDQVELVGGESNPIYGAGEIIKPIYILLSGRATTYVENEKIPVGRIAVEAAREYMGRTIKNIDVDSDVIFDQRLGQGSADLRSVFRRGGVPKSNDTSFGVGFAPLSVTEKLTLDVANYINFKLKLREVGEDIKVMGVRKKNRITLTIASAMVSRHIKDLDHYISAVEEMRSKVCDFACKYIDREELTVDINTGDDYKAGSIFLTAIGTSAEQGDDGSVGRGNRANGLITPYRPMSMEATAGKNPVNHVGKMYNLLSNKIAEDIAKQTGAKQVYVRLMSQIGKPIDHPLVASVHIIGDRRQERKAYRIADEWLANVTSITDLCVKGKVNTF